MGFPAQRSQLPRARAVAILEDAVSDLKASVWSLKHDQPSPALREDLFRLLSGVSAACERVKLALGRP